MIIRHNGSRVGVLALICALTTRFISPIHSVGSLDPHAVSCKHLFITSYNRGTFNTMENTEKKIRIIRDKLSRIGIGERKLDDETILALYSINKYGQLCGLEKTATPAGSLAK